MVNTKFGVNMNMRFYSLTVLDFFEESKEWKEEDFILNCQMHKKELEEIRILRKHNRYYGCRLEIGHLISFLKNGIIRRITLILIYLIHRIFSKSLC